MHRLSLVAVAVILTAATMVAQTDAAGGQATLPTWEHRQRIDPMDSTKSDIFSVDAAQPIDTESGSTMPRLIIRCSGRKLEAYVATDVIVESTHDSLWTALVRRKFDSSKPVAEHWTIGDSHKTLFAAFPSSLVKSLRSSQTFYLEFTPVLEGHADVARFNVAGLTQQLKTHPSGCGLSE